jgi:hypothetical protein
MLPVLNGVVNNLETSSPEVVKTAAFPALFNPVNTNPIVVVIALVPPRYGQSNRWQLTG